MLVDKGPYIVQESFIDDNENAWIVGDVIVWSYWYQRIKASNCSYQLRDDMPLAFFFSSGPCVQV
jgi:hypothetical protein